MHSQLYKIVEKGTFPYVDIQFHFVLKKIQNHGNHLFLYTSNMINFTLKSIFISIQSLTLNVPEVNLEYIFPWKQCYKIVSINSQKTV